MKKILIIGLGLLVLILVGVLACQHFRHSSGPDIRPVSGAEVRAMSEADIRKVFTGNWVMQGATPGELVLHSQGGFISRVRSGPTSDAKQWLYEGTWAVKDDSLTLTITNALTRNTTNSEPVGSVDQLTIIKADRRQLVLQKDSVKIYYVR